MFKILTSNSNTNADGYLAGTIPGNNTYYVGFNLQYDEEPVPFYIDPITGYMFDSSCIYQIYLNTDPSYYTNPLPVISDNSDTLPPVVCSVDVTCGVQCTATVDGIPYGPLVLYDFNSVLVSPEYTNFELAMSPSQSPAPSTFAVHLTAVDFSYLA